jgi:hypothetical protein
VGEAICTWVLVCRHGEVVIMGSSNSNFASDAAQVLSLSYRAQKKSGPAEEKLRVERINTTLLCRAFSRKYEEEDEEATRRLLYSSLTYCLGLVVYDGNPHYYPSHTAGECERKVWPRAPLSCLTHLLSRGAPVTAAHRLKVAGKLTSTYGVVSPHAHSVSK